MGRAPGPGAGSPLGPPTDLIGHPRQKLAERLDQARRRGPTVGGVGQCPGNAAGRALDQGRRFGGSHQLVNLGAVPAPGRVPAQCGGRAADGLVGRRHLGTEEAGRAQVSGQFAPRRGQVVGHLAQQLGQGLAEVLHRHPGVFEAGGRHHDQVDEDPARRTDGGVHDPVQRVPTRRGPQHQHEQGADGDLDRALLAKAQGLAGQDRYEHHQRYRPGMDTGQAGEAKGHEHAYYDPQHPLQAS